MTELVDRRVAAVCRRLEQNPQELVDGVVDELRRQEPLYRSTMSRAELRSAVGPNIEGLLIGVRTQAATNPEASQRTGRKRAEQGIPLATVLAGYRLGVKMVWDYLVAGCAEYDLDQQDERDSASRALLGSATVLWSVYDAKAQELAAEYRTYETERLQRNQLRRQALLAALFGATPTADLTLVEIAGQLGIPSTGNYLILASDQFTRPATTTAPVADIGWPNVWFTGPHSDTCLLALSSGSDRELEQISHKIASLRLGRVGMSRPFGTLVTIPVATSQADTARAVAPPGDQVVNRYDRAEIGSLIAASPEIAAALVTRVLQPLAQMPESDQEVLIDTLHAWFQHGGSTEKAAASLHCHPNTVRYRLNKLQNRLSRDIKVPRDLVDLYLAIEAHRIGRG